MIFSPRAGAAMAAALVLACGAAMAQTPASPAAKARNADMARGLAWGDDADFARANRGFLGSRNDPNIRAADGRIVFALNAYDFVTGDAPDTANPSLWRQAKLLARHGLFQVSERIYQVRGFDIANITFIQGDSGWIVIDPLTSVETARAALQLITEKIGPRPVKAVIYSHSHADHFGGVKGVVDAADVAAGRVAIIAPDGFMEHAVAENLIAGPAMSRRAAYQFGAPLPQSATGQLGAGIGTGLPAGTLSLIPPTQTIKETGETITIDGVTIEFQMTPGTEAPSEMNVYFPQWRVLSLSENANATMHNILPPRGALVRDAKAWADYLTQSLTLYGDRSDVVFLAHTWPRWGKDEVSRFIATHRDAYKYLHDQTVRLMNKGMTAPEIADIIALPPELSKHWFNRGYYGAMRHNARAVYQRYLGWYDANPARLDALPPEESAKRYVEAMGGSARVLTLVEQANAAGDFRWAAELGAHLVFADPNNERAKAVLAQAFDQMGYQSESMVWRNIYLTGAQELRVGVSPRSPTTLSIDMIAATPTPMLFDLLAIRIDPEKAAGQDIAILFAFPERNERTFVRLRNRVLVHEPANVQRPQLTVTLSRANFLRLFFQGADGRAMAMAGEMRLDGEARALQAFGQVLDRAAPHDFAIVTP
jgi:alkyl sulfatase BDS1-like metallo-beta-lactamase superfamily hydrolase